MMVSGHEIRGRVIAAGPDVTRFGQGDHVGVGRMVDSCLGCDGCDDALKQYRRCGPTYIYNALDRDSADLRRLFRPNRREGKIRRENSRRAGLQGCGSAPMRGDHDTVSAVSLQRRQGQQGGRLRAGCARGLASPYARPDAPGAGRVGTRTAPWKEIRPDDVAGPAG